MRSIDRLRLNTLLRDEETKFRLEHPKSHDLYQRARQSMQGGVPMLWMIRWAGTFPVFVKKAKGVHLTDLDGNSYIDFCLGDTGAMTGHSPKATFKAIKAQAGKGITFMLPTGRCHLGGGRTSTPFWITILAIYPDSHRCQSFCHPHGSTYYKSAKNTGV